MSANVLSTFWPEWHIVEPLGKGAFGTVYKISRTERRNVMYAAAKEIRVPRDRSEIADLATMGMDDDSIRQYLSTAVDGMVGEIAVMESLKGANNVVFIEDHHIIESDDGLGWSIWIRMELLTSLVAHAGSSSLSAEETVRMGIDICNALECCHQLDIIHRDVKPENVFISKFGDFKLGDFGIAKRLEESTRSTYSRKYTPAYVAPEVLRMKRYDGRVDIYSLGIMLYRFLNGNRLPLVPPAPQRVTPEIIHDAIGRRLDGERLPAPRYADEELSRIVLKACEADPDKRYSSASELREDLVAWSRPSTIERKPSRWPLYILAASSLALSCVLFAPTFADSGNVTDSASDVVAKPVRPQVSDAAYAGLPEGEEQGMPHEVTESWPDYGTTPSNIQNGGYIASGGKTIYAVGDPGQDPRGLQSEFRRRGIFSYSEDFSGCRCVYQVDASDGRQRDISCLHVGEGSLYFCECYNVESEDSLDWCARRYDIVKTNLDGTDRTILADSLDASGVPYPYANLDVYMWVDGGYIYYLDGNGLYRMPEDAGSREHIADIGGVCSVDDGLVYYTVGDGTGVVCLDALDGSTRDIFVTNVESLNLLDSDTVSSDDERSMRVTCILPDGDRIVLGVKDCASTELDDPLHCINGIVVMSRSGADSTYYGGIDELLQDAHVLSLASVGQALYANIGDANDATGIAEVVISNDGSGCSCVSRFDAKRSQDVAELGQEGDDLIGTWLASANGRLYFESKRPVSQRREELLLIRPDYYDRTTPWSIMPDGSDLRRGVRQV